MQFFEYFFIFLLLFHQTLQKQLFFLTPLYFWTPFFLRLYIAFTTPELMERMSKDYPSFEFKFVIGTDLLTKNNLEEWDTRPEYQNWVERTQFIVLQRPGKEEIQ